MCGMSGSTSYSWPLSFCWPLALLLLLSYSVLDLLSQLPISLSGWSLCCSLFHLIWILICHREKKKKKKKRTKEITLTLSSTFMLPEQKLCLHENQIGKGIKHGDCKTRFSLIPREAQKSGSHCQFPVSVFQPYFQHRLELYATTLGSYSAFPGVGSIWECMTELKLLQS